MKLVILTIFLILGLLGFPSSVFAQESQSTDDILEYSASTFLDNPQVKGGSSSSGGS